MTLDVRATVFCSLGPVIEASISDDYIQGNGLIKSKGACKIKGVVTPAVGEIVVFQYTKNGVTRRIPRTMRVLSSFADPFRRVTSIELGCKLTYLEDLKDPIKWEPLDDPANADRTAEEKEIVTIPIHASSVMAKCVEALGLVAVGPTLTNKFSVAEFDFGNGYVSTLGDLLVSESLCGYLDQDERLVVIDLSGDSASGPVVTSNDLIDIGPIGVGQLPADAVSVAYSTLKLKVPDGEIIVSPEQIEETEDPDDPSNSEPRWGDDIATTVSESEVGLTWSVGSNNYSKTYNVLDITEQRTTYRVFSIKSPDGTIERRNLPIRRVVTESKTAASVIGQVVQQYLTAGRDMGAQMLKSKYVEEFTYDSAGNEVLRVGTRTGDSLYEVGAMGLDFVFRNQSGGYDVVTFSSLEIIIERNITKTVTRNNFQSSTTQRFVTWPKTVYGQQAIADARAYLADASAAASYINTVLGYQKLFLLDTTTSTSATGSRGSAQTAPLPEDEINAKYADSPGEAVGEADETGAARTTKSGAEYRTESVSETEFSLGSGSDTRRIELSMPYAPDDIFTKGSPIPGTDPVLYEYSSTASDAPEKARKFGAVQNRMLLGNRSGMSIQTVPERVPLAPFSPLFVEAAGTIALYRTNACSWVMDASGIITSVEAMFWGTAGRVA